MKRDLKQYLYKLIWNIIGPNKKYLCQNNLNSFRQRPELKKKTANKAVDKKSMNRMVHVFLIAFSAVIVKKILQLG
jgi:hypothetical protein